MIDWDDWPPVRVRAAGLPDGAAREVTVRALTEALARGGPFAAVVEMPPRPPVRVRGALEHVRMVRRLRPALAGHCRGLAFVLPADPRRAHARKIEAGARVWGCPVSAAADLDEACSSPVNPHGPRRGAGR